MKIDADRLRDEADAHERRLQSPLWTTRPGERPDAWMDLVAAESRGPAVEPMGEHPLPTASQPNQGAAYQAAWSSNTAPVDPHTLPRRSQPAPRRPHAWEELASLVDLSLPFDGPDASRRAYCARLPPATYASLKRQQARLGLRTRAAAWDYLLQLGIAAAERLR